MKFIAWLLFYMLALLAEISFFPSFFHLVAPLSFSVFLVGIAFQKFHPGLWFACLAGLARDVLIPQNGISHTAFFLGVFLLVRAFASLSHWEEPLRTIGMVFSGLITSPFAWLAASYLGGALSRTPRPASSVLDLAHEVALTDGIFFAVWLVLFVYLILWYFRRTHALRSSRL